jgi:hypothetical protein
VPVAPMIVLLRRVKPRVAPHSESLLIAHRLPRNHRDLIRGTIDSRIYGESFC